MNYMIAVTGETGKVDGVVELVLGTLFMAGVLGRQQLSRTVDSAAGMTTIYVEAKINRVPLGHLGEDDIPLRP